VSSLSASPLSSSEGTNLTDVRGRAAKRDSHGCERQRLSCAHGAPELRSFVAVAEELHFRRAAERLHLPQPSVSQQIRTLEAELGVPLFERNRRGAVLTPAGSALLGEARELLTRADRAAALVRATGAGERGRLRMSLTRSLTGGVAGAIVAAYRAEYPEVELVLSLGTTMLHVEQLHAGEIDVGFVRPPLEEPGLEELVLGREPMVCVLPRGHRLTRRTSVRPQDLRGEPLVWWPEAHGPGAWREVRREVCGKPPWPPLARAEPEEERIVTAVAEGAGISFIMLDRSRSLRIPGAVYRRFAPPEPTMGIAIAWRRGDSLPPLHRLVELAARVARDVAAAAA
jgi:DNA-binding transcriptional LysR family regulator